MKLKIVNVLTVCLITLAVLSPELVVFGVVWEQHMELVEIQHLACESNQSNPAKLELAPKQEVKTSYQHKRRNKFFNTDFFEQILTIAEQYNIDNILQRFLLLIPILLGLLAFLYDRYLTYRAAIFQKRVEMLERLWQHSIEQ
ncbi:hypothetical protein G7B40_018330 [Aetokthonos hydrillicola Thurmond2011]|jgi:hypothetical protein|uniref:Uncharacterized protein n=1 Tax=Aetokthonos hydrillicola Thurmond2011 TaxID=2712845 RepID=A0AAP5IAF6_9CYAN|nr:hypothetical protein [Aetokthonos hydrillicola]MBO3461038.1 hypothetical protein [Aetokthonos hydrillicola CCALA 1050]MBW4588392.1 hypothetical protein [Aetokthonos hydrillicola CCALA 1050]MDR9896502.1 hypothetical protein [Aetokthonos hydrillicola Thurmond2011]